MENQDNKRPSGDPKPEDSRANDTDSYQETKSTSSDDSGLSGLDTASGAMSSFKSEVNKTSYEHPNDDFEDEGHGRSASRSDHDETVEIEDNLKDKKDKESAATAQSHSRVSNDSGKRTQSLDILTSADLAENFRAKMNVDKCNDVRHAHFADELERSRGVSSPTLSAPPNISVGFSQVAREVRIRKSMSIPVYLTVSKEDCRVLPYNLRPDHFCNIDEFSERYRVHDRDCSISVARRLGGAGIIKPKMTWKATFPMDARKSRIAASASPESKGDKEQTFERPKAPSRTLSNSSTALRSINTTPVMPSKVKVTFKDAYFNVASKVGPVKATKSVTEMMNNEQQDQPMNGYMRATKSSAQRKRKKSKIPPSAMNAELQIWEIQRELKRGEMVQGVLQIGPRLPHQEDACICAPVRIGRTDGHMSWRSM